MKRIFRCDSGSLGEFREVAKLAADLGGTHVYVSDLPKSRWQWERDLADPYPNWGMLHTAIFKVIVPLELEDWLPKEYALRNLEILAERCAILQEHGLKAAFNACEPAWLPSEVYVARPAWRGPRCEHTRRARKSYYAPCIDHPEVLALYRAAVAQLCRTAPIEYFHLLTNDSGGGICWSKGLYPGPNGPTACQHRSFPERIVGFLSTLQQGAADANLELEVAIGGSIPAEEISATRPLLKKGQVIGGYTAEGFAPPVYIGNYDDFYASNVYPVVGIPQPVKFSRDLEVAASAGGGTEVISLPHVDSPELVALLRRHRETPAQGLAQRTTRLLECATGLVGEKHAGEMVDAWDAIDRAVEELAHISESGPLLLLGAVNQRWLVRPLVPFPLELTDSEREYYRRFQFQANTEVEAADLMNLQDIWMVKGFAARYLAEGILQRAVAHLQRATRRIEPIGSETTDLLTLRLEALICVVRNALHCCQYQEILDRTDYSELPNESPVWHVPADPRGLAIRQVVRAELDNTIELIELLECAPGPLLVTALQPEEEDVFLLSPDLTEQLRRKLQIMLAHENDHNRLYARFN